MEPVRQVRLVGILSWSLLAAAILLAGCSGDSAPNASEEPDDETVRVDTSTLEIARLNHTAYDADGEVETGLTLQWRLSFQSTMGRTCRIQSYRLINSRQGEVYRREEPIPEFIDSGLEITDKEIWIALDGPSSAGSYTFFVTYETGYFLADHEDRPRWNGPLSSGTASRLFTAVPRN